MPGLGQTTGQQRGKWLEDKSPESTLLLIAAQLIIYTIIAINLLTTVNLQLITFWKSFSQPLWHSHAAADVNEK